MASLVRRAVMELRSSSGFRELRRGYTARNQSKDFVWSVREDPRIATKSKMFSGLDTEQALSSFFNEFPDEVERKGDVDRRTETRNKRVARFMSAPMMPRKTPEIKEPVSGETIEESIRRTRISAEEQVNLLEKRKKDNSEKSEESSSPDLTKEEEEPERRPLFRRDLHKKFRGAPYEDPSKALPIYPPNRSVRIRAIQIKRRVLKFESLGMKNSKRAVVESTLKHMQVGDVVRICSKDIYTENAKNFFTGVVMDYRRKGINSSFILRNVLDGVAVERGFHTHSPTIISAQLLTHKRVRGKKLFYLRHAKTAISNVGNTLK